LPRNMRTMPASSSNMARYTIEEPMDENGSMPIMNFPSRIAAAG